MANFKCGPNEKSISPYHYACVETGQSFVNWYVPNVFDSYSCTSTVVYAFETPKELIVSCTGTLKTSMSARNWTEQVEKLRAEIGRKHQIKQEAERKKERTGGGFAGHI